MKTTIIILAAVLAMALPAAAQTRYLGDANCPIQVEMTGADGNAMAGLEPNVIILKNGGSWETPSGALSDKGHGIYQVTATAGDYDTYGPLLVRAYATGCVPYSGGYFVDSRRDANLTDLQALLVATRAAVWEANQRIVGMEANQVLLVNYVKTLLETAILGNDANMKEARGILAGKVIEANDRICALLGLTDANAVVRHGLLATAIGTNLTAILGNDANAVVRHGLLTTALTNLPAGVWNYDGNRSVNQSVMLSAIPATWLVAIWGDANRSLTQTVGTSTLTALQVWGYDGNRSPTQTVMLPTIPASWLTAVWGDSNRSLTQDIAAGDDANTVAGRVWDIGMSEHVAAGSAGYTLNALTSSTGTGSNAVVVWVVDANSGTPIQGAKVRATYNTDSTILTAGADGNVRFTLLTYTYVLAASAPGYDGNQVSKVVSGASTQTIRLNANALPSTSAPGMCACSLTVYGGDGQPVAGKILTAILKTVPSGNGSGFVGTPISETSDASGALVLTLWRKGVYELFSGGVKVGADVTISDAASMSLPSVKVK